MSTVWLDRQNVQRKECNQSSDNRHPAEVLWHLPNYKQSNPVQQLYTKYNFDD